MLTSRRHFNQLALAALAGFSVPSFARAEAPAIGISIQFGLAYLPVMVADHLNLFSKEAEKRGQKGAKFSTVQLSGSPATIDALLSGRVGISALGVVGALLLIDKTRKTLKVKGLAGLAMTPYVLYVNDARIKTLTDFGPQDKIAVSASNSPQAILLEMAAKKQLGNPKALSNNMVSLPHPDAMAALTAGKTIKGYFSTPPFSGYLAQNDKMHKILTSTDVVGGSPTGAFLVAKDEFAKTRPEISAAVVAAIAEADKFIKENPRQAAEIYLKFEPAKLSVDQIQALITDPAGGYSPVPQKLKAFADFLYDQKSIQTPVGNWQEVFFPYAEKYAGK